MKMEGRKKSGIVGIALVFVFFLGIALLPGTSSAAPPVVKTVPWVATNPLIPHDTWSGKSIGLKGTCDSQGANFQYTWDFGDGSPVAIGTVGNMRVIEATHAYTGPVGTIFTARLTVQNTSIPAPNTASKEYYVQMRAKSLQVETNVAIDEGLWYLHKTMVPYLTDQGYWAYNYNAETPANLNAFFVNGHLETGAATNPYTETVQRGMKRLFTLLTATGISLQTYPAPIGTVNPDGNGNGLGIYAVETYPYSSGIYMDAIVASGTPDAMTTTGGANVIGRKYRDIVQDMVDGYAYGQTDSGTWMGGWGYDWNNGNSDNSVNQWAAIGLLGAESWGITVPNFVKLANMNSLNNTQATTANCSASYNGAFAYTNNYCYFPWGPWGTTPAGMVQMVLDGIGRGNAQWDRTENYVRNNFCNPSTSSQSNIRAYYYGLFSFTKSMLLYPGGGIQSLANQPGNTNPIDWYSAEASAGAPCNGVARTLVNDQLAAGNWGAHNDFGYHTYFSTAWAIIMLNRTVFESGLPVAVANAIPNPAVAGQPINLSGAGSFHQDSTKSIDSWEWDLDNNGTFETTGVATTVSFGLVGDYPVSLRVSDNGTPEKFATTTVTIRVNTPPIAPTADAGGPYNFCTNRTPWFLDGTGSVNPDEGQSEPGKPGDTIYGLNQFAWELNGNASFDDKFGQTPDVTGFWGVGSYLIQLKVCDTTAASFPSSGQPNLCSTDSAQVFVRASSEPECATCPNNLTARPKLNKAELRWTPRAGAVGYNIYRGTINGGPYLKIGQVNGAVGFYLDSGSLSKITYYYIVRERALNGSELCQSNQATCVVTGR